MTRKTKIWIAVVVIPLVAMGAYVGNWFIERQGRLSAAHPDALAALESSASVAVRIDDWTVFMPTAGKASTGFIFYPGGECDERGYAELLHAIAARGYLVVLVPMPLQLAVLAPSKADEVIEAYPGIETWVIGGHSLGGAMAARYVYRNPGKLEGLLFWDAYPPKTDDVSDRTLAVGLIHRADEKLLPPDYYEEYRSLLPDDMVYWPIPGGNHINFGRFLPAERFRSDVESATLPIEDQHRQIVEYSAQFLSSITKQN
jgi:hypothetical protein